MRVFTLFLHVVAFLCRSRRKTEADSNRGSKIELEEKIQKTVTFLHLSE